MVELLSGNIKTSRPSKRLDYKKIGPFKILAKIGTSTYKFALRPSMGRHKPFHTSLIKPYQEKQFPL